jgi:hypothetical protein
MADKRQRKRQANDLNRLGENVLMLNDKSANLIERSNVVLKRAHEAGERFQAIGAKMKQK